MQVGKQQNQNKQTQERDKQLFVSCYKLSVAAAAFHILSYNQYNHQLNLNPKVNNHK
jgi:hypothetical protein